MLLIGEIVKRPCSLHGSQHQCGLSIWKGFFVSVTISLSREILITYHEVRLVDMLNYRLQFAEIYTEPLIIHLHEVDQVALPQSMSSS